VIEIVKNQLDFGLITNRREVIDFWQDEIGLPLDHVLRVRRGQDQYRFDVGGSVIKVNLLSDHEWKGEERSGYDELWIAKPGIDQPQTFVDPDGNRMCFVPPDSGGVTQIGARLRVPELARALHHYRDVLGFDAIGDAAVRCGESVVLLIEDPDAPTGIERPGRGWTYLTVQVRDCDAEVARVEAAGARITTRPINLGEVARMAMVSDPDGNLLEISQRASLTGPLPFQEDRKRATKNPREDR
jgi:predicted enzyme related to lactoylglutathione lyase